MVTVDLLGSYISLTFSSSLLFFSFSSDRGRAILTEIRSFRREKENIAAAHKKKKKKLSLNISSHLREKVDRMRDIWTKFLVER